MVGFELRRVGAGDSEIWYPGPFEGREAPSERFHEGAQAVRSKWGNLVLKAGGRGVLKRRGLGF